MEIGMKFKDFVERNSLVGYYAPHPEVSIDSIEGNYMKGRHNLGYEWEVFVHKVPIGHGIHNGRVYKLRVMEPRQSIAEPDEMLGSIQGVRASYDRGWIVKPEQPDVYQVVIDLIGMYPTGHEGETVGTPAPAPEETSKEKQTASMALGESLKEDSDKKWKARLWEADLHDMDDANLDAEPGDQDDWGKKKKKKKDEKGKEKGVNAPEEPRFEDIDEATYGPIDKLRNILKGETWKVISDTGSSIKVTHLGGDVYKIKGKAKSKNIKGQKDMVDYVRAISMGIKSVIQEREIEQERIQADIEWARLVYGVERAECMILERQMQQLALPGMEKFKKKTPDEKREQMRKQIVAQLKKQGIKVTQFWWNSSIDPKSGANITAGWGAGLEKVVDGKKVKFVYDSQKDKATQVG